MWVSVSKRQAYGHGVSSVGAGKRRSPAESQKPVVRSHDGQRRRYRTNHEVDTTGRMDRTVSVDTSGGGGDGGEEDGRRIGRNPHWAEQCAHFLKRNIKT